jgi:hypothetical protein
MQDTCPVHVAKALIGELPDGAALFDGMSASGALRSLRQCLKELEVKEACAYRTHDLRRGHALDLQLAGCPVAYA